MFFDYLKDSLDVLYSESAQYPLIMSVGLHPRIVGRPGRIGALERFLEVTRRLPGVTYLTRDEIADFWLSEFGS